jgi:magnesium chelatase family protein
MSSALKNSGFASPKNQNQKIVISLSPADLKKEGPYFDLAIALAYLLSAEEVDFDPEGRIFLGELSLNGELQPIKGTLPLAQEAKRLGYKEIFVPLANAEEAALVEGITVYGAQTLKEVIDHIYKIKYDKKGNPIEQEQQILRETRASLKYGKRYSSAAELLRDTLGDQWKNSPTRSSRRRNSKKTSEDLKSRGSMRSKR